MSLIRRSDKGQPLTAADHDANLKHLEGFADLPALLAERSGYGFYKEGEIVTTRAEGFRYRVVAADSEDPCLTIAGGLKLRVLPGPDGSYNFDAWAPAANGHLSAALRTDDYPRLRHAIDIVPEGSTIAFMRPVTYFIGQTVFFKKVVYLKGTRSGISNGASATLKWPVDTTGFKFERHNTLDGQVESTPSGASDGSIVDGLNLEGTRGTDKTKHGIHGVCRVLIRNCRITRFSGDGVHIYGASDQCTSGRNHTICGNANCVQIYTTQAGGNGGNGFYIRGYDGNAGYCYGLNATSNGRWGIVDRSFLGNTHVGHHVATNGVAGVGGNPAGHSSFVHFEGARYSAHPDASEAQLAATQPGTDSNIWVLRHAGGQHPNIPTWQADQPEGTYFVGGSYYLRGANARNVLLGCYSEGGSAASFISGPSIVMGGMHGAGFSSGGLIAGVSGNALRASQFHSVADASGGTEDAAPQDAGTESVLGGVSGSILQFRNNDDSSGWFRFQYYQGNYVVRRNNLNASTSIGFTGDGTSTTMGRSEPQVGVWWFPRIGIGSGNSIRQHTTGTTAPTSGNWARGDIVWNRDPSAGGHAGWICIAAGSPGAWRGFGSIEP